MFLTLQASGTHRPVSSLTEMALLFLFVVVFVLCLASSFLDEENDEAHHKPGREAESPSRRVPKKPRQGQGMA